MNTIGYFEIQLSNLKREVEFYKAIFDWKFIKDEFVPIEYYKIETNTIKVGLLKRPAPATTAGTNTFVCLIQVTPNTGKVISSILTTILLKYSKLMNLQSNISSLNHSKKNYFRPIKEVL